MNSNQREIIQNLADAIKAGAENGHDTRTLESLARSLVSELARINKDR